MIFGCGNLSSSKCSEWPNVSKIGKFSDFNQKDTDKMAKNSAGACVNMVVYCGSLLKTDKTKPI